MLDCPLHRNIYLFSHSTLELPGASAPPPPEAGQEVQRTQPGWGQPDWQDLGARAPLCSQRSLSSHPLEALLCPGLSVPVLGWGVGRETLLGINFTLWIWLALLFAAPKPSPGLRPRLLRSCRSVVV